jgi:hypothetical protein
MERPPICVLVPPHRRLDETADGNSDQEIAGRLPKLWWSSGEGLLKLAPTMFAWEDDYPVFADSCAFGRT